MKSRTELASRILLVAGSLVFVWFLVELPALINIVDYQTLEYHGVWGDWRFIRVPDAQLTHLEPPHAHYKGSSYGGDAESSFRIPQSDQTLFHWDLKYDHNGFRNGSDAASTDIAVIGDSMIEGMTVSDSEVVTSVLAKSTGRTVTNFGQYGYGPQQEMIVLKRYGLPLKPHVIVWEFSESTDLLDAVRYHDIALHPPGFWNFFLQRSFTRFAWRTVSRLFASPKPNGATRSGILQAGNEHPATVYFSVPFHALTAEELSGVEEVTGILAEARRLADASGARLLVVFAPDKFRVYHDFCRYPAGSECSRWVVNDLPDRLRKAVGTISPDIGFIDLTDGLVSATRSGSPPYYPDDVHWTPVGHRIAGEAIGAYLAAHP